MDRIDPASIDAVVANAVAFLRERLRSGAYGLACIGSDGTPRFSNDKGHVFVAAFIAEAMQGLFDEVDRTLVVVGFCPRKTPDFGDTRLPVRTIASSFGCSMSIPTTRHT